MSIIADKKIQSATAMLNASIGKNGYNLHAYRDVAMALDRFGETENHVYELLRTAAAQHHDRLDPRIIFYFEAGDVYFETEGWDKLPQKLFVFVPAPQNVTINLAPLAHPVAEGDVIATALLNRGVVPSTPARDIIAAQSATISNVATPLTSSTTQEIQTMNNQTANTSTVASVLTASTIQENQLMTSQQTPVTAPAFDAATAFNAADFAEITSMIESSDNDVNNSLADMVAAALTHEIPAQLSNRFVFESPEAPTNISKAEVEAIGEALVMIDAGATAMKLKTQGVQAWIVEFPAIFHTQRVDASGNIAVAVQLSEKTGRWSVQDVLRDPLTGRPSFAPNGEPQVRKAFGMKVITLNSTSAVIVVPNSVKLFERHNEAFIAAGATKITYKGQAQWLFADGKLPEAVLPIIKEAREYAEAYNQQSFLNKFVAIVMLTQPMFAGITWMTTLSVGQVGQAVQYGSRSQSASNVANTRKAQRQERAAERSAATAPRTPAINTTGAPTSQQTYAQNRAALNRRMNRN